MREIRLLCVYREVLMLVDFEKERSYEPTGG